MDYCTYKLPAVGIWSRYDMSDKSPQIRGITAPGKRRQRHWTILISIRSVISRKTSGKCLVLNLHLALCSCSYSGTWSWKGDDVWHLSQEMQVCSRRCQGCWWGLCSGACCFWQWERHHSALWKSHTNLYLDKGLRPPTSVTCSWKS